MQIEYELSETDILALMKFRIHQSRGMRNPVMRRRIGYFVGFAMIGVGMWPFFRQPVLPAIFLLWAMVSFLFYPILFTWLLQRRVATEYRDPKKRATLASRIVCINDDGLQEISHFGETKIKWDIKVLKKHAPPHAGKFLVSARCDVSPVTVDRSTIIRTLATFGLDDYFKTSAKTGEGVEALFQRLMSEIPRHHTTRIM